jgi:hypothetical protein
MRVSHFGSFDIGYSISTNDNCFVIKDIDKNEYFSEIQMMSEDEDTCGNKISLGLKIQSNYGLLIDITDKATHRESEKLFDKYLSTTDFKLRFDDANPREIQDTHKRSILKKIYLHIFPFGIGFIERIYQIDEQEVQNLLNILKCFEYSSYGNKELSNTKLIESINETLKSLKKKKIIIENNGIMNLTRRTNQATTEYFINYSTMIGTYRPNNCKQIKSLIKIERLTEVINNEDYSIFAGWYITCILCSNKDEIEDYFRDWRFFFKYFNFLDAYCNLLNDILRVSTERITEKYVANKMFRGINAIYLQRLKIMMLLGYNNTNYETVSMTRDVIDVFDYYERYACINKHRAEIKSSIESLEEIAVTKLNKKISIITLIISVLCAFIAPLAINEISKSSIWTKLITSIMDIFTRM